MQSAPTKKAKRKKHRKALRQAELLAYQKGLKELEKWRKEYFESLKDYPVTKSKKRLSWRDYKKAFKKNNPK
jgi:hypothetical protein